MTVSGSVLHNFIARYLSLSNAMTLLTLTLFVNGFGLALPLFSMQVFDRVLTSGSLSTLALLTLVIVAIVICQAFIDGSRTLMLNRIALKAERRALAAAISSKAFQGMLQLEQRAFQPQNLGTSSVVGIAVAVCDAPWSVIFISALFLLHYSLGIFAVVSVMIIAALTFLGQVITSRLRGESSQGYSHGLELLQSASRSNAESKVMGMSSALREKGGLILSNASLQNLHAADRQAWIDTTLRAARTVLQVFILALAATLVLSQETQSGTIVAASMLFARALVPAERLMIAIPYITRLLRDAAGEATDDNRMLAPIGLPPLTGKIEVSALSVLSASGRRVLDDVSCVFKEGQIVVVVGEQGAGKSLLLQAIVGATAASSGSVRIDGNAVADIEEAELSIQVGYVAESYNIGCGPVSSLISRLGEPHDESVVDACKLAGAHAILQSLPFGYQTVVGATATTLSHGQMKRLVLARAFYQRPRVIVLDDPLSGLDDEGERTILQAIVELNKAGSTIVVASRHPRLAHLADRLIMLSQGRVTLDCNRDEVATYLLPRLAQNAA